MTQKVIQTQVSTFDIAGSRVAFPVLFSVIMIREVWCYF